MAEYEYEVTCKVIRGERDLAYGDDCYCYYTQANYDERIIRCRDCEYDCGDGDKGFCAWGKPKVVE